MIFVYAALRAALRISARWAAAIALLIAVVIEFGQLFGVLDLLGLQGNPIARIVLGHGFDVKDLLAYAAGALVILGAEHFAARR